MLTNLLAWSLAIASLGLYLSGFFLPELYRKFDLVASGAGLFFALTLWIYGERINGGLLLGTSAGVALILWFGWQTLQYRWQLTHPSERTNTQKAQALWQRAQALLPQGILTQVKERLQGLLNRGVGKAAAKEEIDAAPPSSAAPPMDTSSSMQADLREDGQASTSPPEGETVPTSTQSTIAGSPPVAETPAQRRETELPQSAAAAETEQVKAANAPEQPSLEENISAASSAQVADALGPTGAAPHADEGSTDLAAEATPASATDLSDDTPETSHEETSATTPGNPEHLPSPAETTQDDTWPPPGTSL